MRNPIFASDTVFTEQAPDGTVRRLSADGEKTFTCGSRLVELSERQPLLEIKTAGGSGLIMSPESVFSLSKDGEGNPVRFHPVHVASSQDLTAVDFNESVSPEAIRFMMAGMIVARGNHLFDRFRASSLIAPVSQAAPMEAYLKNIGDHWQRLEVIHPKSNRVTLIEHEDGYFLRSRILTRLIGSLIKDGTQEPLFIPSSVHPQLFWAFMKGLLSTAYREDGDLVFRHRYADVVRLLSTELWTQFGVPSKLMVDPMEPSVQQNIMVPKAHQFRLSSEEQKLAVTAGLIDGSDGSTSSRISEAILSVTPLKSKKKAVIVVPGMGRDSPIMANGFIFVPQFEIPRNSEYLATHPILLDSSDPSVL